MNRKISIKKIIRNINILLRFDLKIELRDLKRENQKLRAELSEIDNRILYHKILDYYEQSPDPLFDKELKFLLNKGKLYNFPYEHQKKLGQVDVFFDKKKKLPYVLHKGIKQLYFPQNWTLEQTKASYIDYIENENLLGGGYTNPAPHKYESDTFFVEHGDILLDIGAAEALFALELIEKVSKVYIFEGNEIWFEPLEATFEPYKEKVVLVKKKVSDVDSESTTRIDTAIGNDRHKSLFVKMDIEGYEKNILQSHKDFFVRMQKLKLVCCTYHEHNDAKNINKLLIEMKFNTEFSEGYVLFIKDKLRPPFFRKGLIRAWRQ